MFNPKSSDASPGEGKKIIVAEDDPGILDAVTILLRVVGYEVTTTTTGQAILELRAGNLPDAILLDLWLSGADGRDICKQLKSKKMTAGIPVIIFSANNDIKTIAKDCGADDYLPKPFEIDELLQKIKAAVSGIR